MIPDSAKQEAIRVTLVGMVIDIILGAAKILGGVLTNSFALITDGIHSLTDAATDVFVLIVARYAHADADAEHPYGHGRFETLGTIAMGMVFFTSAGILLYDSYQRLRDISLLPVPALGGIALALISIASKEWIYQYTIRVARRLNSSLLKANAWHSRSDAISSIAVLIGLIGAQQGMVWMDTVAAIFVALIIAKIGWELCADSLKELVDTAVSDERQQQLRACVLGIDGIRGVTSLRSRLSGGKMILEVRILVDARISVSEGHQLGEIVSRTLRGKFSDIGDVIVHIDPHNHDELDPAARPAQHFPERSEVMALIRLQWQDLLKDDDVERMDLHYLEHGIEIELTIFRAEVSPLLISQLERAVQTLNFIAGVRIYHKLYESPRERQLS
jgi:cation diffusion facilitator family transporter